MGDGLKQVTKHPDYYLRDGSVSFLTGGFLFRVHQSFFERESDVFRDFFADATEEDPQSGTDDSPFMLDDVQPDEFAQFLWVWYDREYLYKQQTKENWIKILKLAIRWAFPKIKELAIREIDALGLPPAERIAIYNDHGIDDDRLLNSYVELCKSPTVPTAEEGHLIQMETLINVLQAREDARRESLKLRHGSPTSPDLEDETLRDIVSRILRPGLNPRSGGPSTTGSGVQASDLNGERAQGTSSSGTITLGKPQVPDKRTQSDKATTHAVEFVLQQSHLSSRTTIEQSPPGRRQGKGKAREGELSGGGWEATEEPEGGTEVTEQPPAQMRQIISPPSVSVVQAMDVVYFLVACMALIADRYM